ncbi:MAG: hypothetical protein U0Z44_15380 [Kouleothrix sp.]
MGLRSEALGLRGRLDLAIAVPSRAAAGAEAIVVEYKDSEKPDGCTSSSSWRRTPLLEQTWGLPVRRGYLQHPVARIGDHRDLAGVAGQRCAGGSGHAGDGGGRADGLRWPAGDRVSCESPAFLQ